jgi:hemophore-related protein
MISSMCSARRALAATIGAGVIAGATLVAVAPLALADPPPPPAPGCSAADFEQLQSQVAAATSAYFFSHPDANAFFSTLKGLPKDEVRSQSKAYLAANPQTQSDLAGIRQPLRDMKARCQ